MISFDVYYHTRMHCYMQRCIRQTIQDYVWACGFCKDTTNYIRKNYVKYTIKIF